MEKLASTPLQRSRDKLTFYEKIIAMMPGHIYWQDRNGVVLGCNDQQAKSYGFSSSKDLIGKTVFAVQPGEYAEKIADVNRRVVEGREPLTVEETALVGGRRRIYLSQKVPLFDHDGEVFGILGISTDITDQKNLEKQFQDAKELAEAAIRARDESLAELNQLVTGQSLKNQSAELSAIEMKDYLENIIALMPGHVYWQDKNGMILGCNDQQARSFGKTRRELIGKTAYDLLPEAQADALRELNEKIMQTNEPHFAEETGIMGDGQLHTYFSQKVPLYSLSGETIGVLGTSIDISERKKTEQLLVEAKENAEMAGRAKAQFISNMEHDLRTPASGIYGLIEAMVKSETNPEKKENLTLVLDSTRELLKLLNEILAFDQIEMGTHPVQDRKFDLHSLLSSVVKLEKSSGQIKKVQLISKTDSDVPTYVIGDPFRLNRILINLVGNAVKFTHHGSVMLSVALAKRINSRQIVLQFTVQDTGIGIPQERQEVIFEKFNKLVLSNTGRYKGIGVGLRVVKQFVEELDGDFELESEVGVGTKFTCFIPFKLPLLDLQEADGKG